jgi:hypothetical protein
MKVIRFAERNWRPDARTLISTGDYWIPRDMSEELADRALQEGAAVLVSEERETKPAQLALEIKPAAVQTPANAPVRQRAAKRVNQPTQQALE